MQRNTEENSVQATVSKGSEVHPTLASKAGEVWLKSLKAYFELKQISKEVDKVYAEVRELKEAQKKASVTNLESREVAEEAYQEAKKIYQEVYQYAKEAKQEYEEAKVKVKEAYSEPEKVYQEGNREASVLPKVSEQDKKSVKEAKNTDNKSHCVELENDTSTNEIDQDPNERYLKNIQFAKEAYDYCREKIPFENSSTQPFVTDKEKILLVRDQVVKARSRKVKKSELVFYISRYPNNDFFKKLSKDRKTSKKHQVGNCDELSSLAMNYLRKKIREKKIQRVEMVRIIDGDHVFVVIDREGDNLNDVSTWGKSCVILDVLNNEIFPPAEIYSKLKCYRFDIDSPNPHILTDFTANDKLSVKGEISYHKNVSENLLTIEQFNKKLDIIANSCSNYLDIQKYNELKQIIDENKQSYNNDLASLDLEKVLGKKIKQIIKFIKCEKDQDKIFNEILINLMTIVYDEGKTLHTAVYNGYFKIVEELLNFGINPYAANHGVLPLHIATKEGYLDIVKLLLNHDENFIINYQKGNGSTALHIAVHNGYVEIVKELLNRGADPYLMNKKGFLPLHLAAREGHLDIVKLLLNHNKNQRINDKTSDNWDGWTALHLAINNGYVKIVKELLNRGANPYLVNPEGFLPLHLAVREGHLYIVKLLLNHNKNIIDEQMSDGSTALHFAILNEDVKMVKELLKRGANPYLVNQEDIERVMGNEKIIKLLTNAKSLTNITLNKNSNISQHNIFTAGGSIAANSKNYSMPIQKISQGSGK